MEKLKQYYTTVYCMSTSPCGTYLAAGSSYGDVAIFKIGFLIHTDENSSYGEEKFPIFKFSAHKGKIYSMASSQKLLITGAEGDIKIWLWSDIINRKENPMWTFNIPVSSDIDILIKPEINSIVLSKKEEDGFIYAGCGNNKIYCIDLKSQSARFYLDEHTDYIHCLDAANTSSNIVSASEDGTVRIWDSRATKKSIHIFEPSHHKIAGRPWIGKWIGCVGYSPTDEWLVFGGAVNLSTWSLRTHTVLAKMDKYFVKHHAVLYRKDEIISAGTEAFINHWSLDGSLQMEISTTADYNFAIEINNNFNEPVLFSSGADYRIDVFKGCRHKETTLLFAENKC